MDIYFVRHGETSGNIARRHQQEESRLTALGRLQAERAAEAVAKLEPTHLYVSHRVRTIETGRAIAAHTGLTPETSELFVELCRPEAMYGHFHRSVRTARYLWQWWRGNIGSDACGPAGESYAAFRQRLAMARAFLETLPDDARVVVVSHSVFISLFIAHMHREGPLTFIQALRTYLFIKQLHNGSITQLRYEGDTWSTASEC